MKTFTILADSACYLADVLSRLRAAGRSAAARLCRGRRHVQPAGRHDLRQHLGRGDQLQGPHLRAASRTRSTDGVRSDRQIPPLAGRRAVSTGRTACASTREDNIWATDVALPYRLQVEPGRPHPARARRARQRGRDALRTDICGCSTSRTTWRSGRRRGLRGAGPRPRRAEGRQVRHGRQLHQGLGQERVPDRANSTSPIRSRSTPRACSTWPTATTSASRCSTATAQYLREIQASGNAVRPVHRSRPAHLARARTCRTADQARS